jgi:hypothetical protein
MKGQTFEPVDVLRRVGEAELVRYRCFRVLPDNKYWVQGADRYRLPLSEEQREEVAEQSRRVLAAVPFRAGDETDERLGRMYDSLDEAVMAFEGNYSR